MEASSSGSVILAAPIGKPVTHQPGKIFVSLLLLRVFFIKVIHAMNIRTTS